jgi:molecular chaperone GrpE
MTPDEMPMDDKENKDVEIKSTDLDGETKVSSGYESKDTPDGEEISQGSIDEPIAAQDEALQAEVADLNDKLLRALAETENIRRRADRDKTDATKYAITNFAREMLTISDTLQRALGIVDEDARKEHAVIEQLFIGMEMNEREIKNIFERFGIRVIKAIDEKFDHNFHEAMFEIDDPSKPAGTVVQEVEAGYTIKDRLLRPAKVGVSKGGPSSDKNITKVDSNFDDKLSENISDQKTAYEEVGAETGAQLDEEL